MVQLELALDWGTEPWSGQSPRSLAKFSRGHWRDVDKSRTLPEPATGTQNTLDPAQLTMWIHSTPSKEFSHG